MPTIRTSLATPTQPWEVAVAEFIAELSPSEAALYCDPTLENLFYDASFAQKTHAIGSRSWRFTDRLSPLIDAIEDYGKALDVAVNTYPIALSPIWGCLRVILQVRGDLRRHALAQQLTCLADYRSPRAPPNSKNSLSKCWVKLVTFCHDFAFMRRFSRGMSVYSEHCPKLRRNEETVRTSEQIEV
jgi:hypothetical protein